MPGLKLQFSRYLGRPRLILAVGLSAITLSVLAVAQAGLLSPVSADYTVMLTDTGFNPTNLTIKSGQTVRFTTNRGQLFWPASDLHPIHNLYPEFDPKNPIKPTESWTFRFTKVGRWPFHDHLAPYFTGTIEVVK